MAEISGHAAPGWEPLAEAFRANFERGDELGAACCVYLRGRAVVDLWGGIADERSRRPWTKDTVVPVFSTTKGATAICAHMLVERGELDLNAPVVTYWPEFGQGGKERTQVGLLLSHKAGLPAIDVELTLEQICAWDRVIHTLEAQQPFWDPGTQYLYHPHTYGFLVGEIVRQVTGRTIGRFFSDEVASPLRLDSWIGAPAAVEPRVAHLVLDPPPEDPVTGLASLYESLGLKAASANRAAAAMQAILADPESIVARSLNLGGAFPDGFASIADVLNTRLGRAAELPGVNLITDARSLARMYAATIGHVDGTRLLEPETLKEIFQERMPESPPYGWPVVLHPLVGLVLDTALARGFMRACPAEPLLGPRSFGHPGAGGSIAFADPDANVGFAYVMNRMVLVGERRARSLIEALSRCLA